MSYVNLRSIPELQDALAALGTEFERETEQAFRRAARFGVTALLRTSAQTNPRPKASGTYERAWVVIPVKGGAALSNSARHAIFVEVGRRPGRQPPLEAITEWVLQKRIVQRYKGKNARRGEARRWRARFIARYIARAIGKRGVKGRYVFQRTMPAIAQRSAYEIRRAITKLCQSPPR